jgi:hypothetical protein
MICMLCCFASYADMLTYFNKYIFVLFSIYPSIPCMSTGGREEGEAPSESLGAVSEGGGAGDGTERG